METKSANWKVCAGTGLVLCVALTAVADETHQADVRPKQSTEFGDVPVSRAANAGRIVRSAGGSLPALARTSQSSADGRRVDSGLGKQAAGFGRTRTRGPAAETQLAAEARSARTKQLKLSWTFTVSQADSRGQTGRIPNAGDSSAFARTPVAQSGGVIDPAGRSSRSSDR